MACATGRVHDVHHNDAHVACSQDSARSSCGLHQVKRCRLLVHHFEDPPRWSSSVRLQLAIFEAHEIGWLQLHSPAGTLHVEHMLHRWGKLDHIVWLDHTPKMLHPSPRKHHVVHACLSNCFHSTLNLLIFSASPLLHLCEASCLCNVAVASTLPQCNLVPYFPAVDQIHATSPKSMTRSYQAN